jgi:hypothetical protein
MELIRLAVGLQSLLELVDLSRGRRGVVAAEQPEQRAVQIPGPLDQGRHAVQRVALGRGADDIAAVAVHRRVDRQADRGQEGLPPARAVADHADLAVGVAQPAQVGGGARHLAHDPLVRDGNGALSPGRGHRVVRAGPRRLTVIEVRHHRVVPARG